jgi:hypothetical protein
MKKNLIFILSMILRSLVVFILALCDTRLYSQPLTTTITDTVYNSVTGSPFGGSVVIQGPNIIAPNNITILGISRTVNIVNGALTVTLVPNTTATPASTYSMTFSNGDKKTCTVPYSATPLTLSAAGCVDGSQQILPIFYTPPSSSSPCTVGQTAFDTNFSYYCIASGTWKRGVISTW